MKLDGGTVSVEGDKLVFELHGVDEIFAIQRRITVPLEHVISVSTDKVPWAYGEQLRVGGTGIPGLVKDGRYLGDGGAYMFFEMHNPNKCITVNLDHETYKKIVFEVDDKEATARTIEDALRARDQ